MALVCANSVSAALASDKTDERPPNFIIIFSDDQGYQDLGCYGSPDIKTPRIDQMANEGMRFTNFYAQTVCGPSRAALMTGCYPPRVARQSDPNSIHPELHLDEITIAEVLKQQGYATAAVGKWDLAGHNPAKYKPELLPTHQGFDEFFGTPGSNDSKVDLIRDQQKIDDNADMSTLTRRYTDEAIAFMERQKEKPFFLYLAHTMPHTKLAASKQFKGKSAHGLYGDVIEELDFNVGRVLDRVKELGLDDNTYVIFTSDNGPWLIRNDNGGHADPLRSGKTSCWEGGMRVPCVVRAPGKVPAGSECSAVSATIDLLPTLAKLASASAPADRAIDGVDISELVHGQKAELKRSYFYYQHNCLRAVRSGKWKLMLPHTEPVKTSILKRWKRHVAKADALRLNKVELYDLESDIGESTDLAEQHPDLVAELRNLAQWARNDIGDHDRFGNNARTFGSKPRTLSSGKDPFKTEAGNANGVPGDKVEFNGFDRYTFEVNGTQISVVCPEEAAAGKPWLWRSMFWGSTKGATSRVTLMDLELVKQGYHVVIRPGDVSGHPRGNAAIDTAYNHLTEKHRFCKKVSMGSMSRETLSLFQWATVNPEKVASIYVDNGVCNVKSWPAGKLVEGSGSIGTGNSKSWELLKTTYGFNSDQEALAAKLSPIDWLEPLAKAGVPILMASGTKDLVVPYEENAAILKERYEKLGGNVKVILEDKGHHPHGLKDPSPVIEFIIENTPK